MQPHLRVFAATFAVAYLFFVAEGSRPDKNANDHVSLAASGRSLNAFQVLHDDAPTQAEVDKQQAASPQEVVPSLQAVPADSEDAQEVVPSSKEVPADPQDAASQSQDAKEEEEDAGEGEEQAKPKEVDKEPKDFAWTQKGVEWASPYFKDDKVAAFLPKSAAPLQPEQVAQLVAAMGKDDFDDDDIAEGLENGYIVKAQPALSPATAAVASIAPIPPKPLQAAAPPHAVLQSKLSIAHAKAQATPQAAPDGDTDIDTAQPAQAGQSKTATQPTQTALQERLVHLDSPAWMVKIAGFFRR